MFEVLISFFPYLVAYGNYTWNWDLDEKRVGIFFYIIPGDLELEGF